MPRKTQKRRQMKKKTMKRKRVIRKSKGGVKQDPIVRDILRVERKDDPFVDFDKLTPAQLFNTFIGAIDALIREIAEDDMSHSEFSQYSDDGYVDYLEMVLRECWKRMKEEDKHYLKANLPNIERSMTFTDITRDFETDFSIFRRQLDRRYN